MIASSRMNELEALLWRAERHPQLSSTLTIVGLLDCVPDWDRLRAAHEWGTQVVPRFRQRVVEPLVPVGPPAWVTDPDFDLAHHLKRFEIPPPGGLRQGLDRGQAFAMAPFDRTRPLWEGILVEGRNGDRAAYVLKVHHAWTDGLGGIQLLSQVLSRTREHTPDKPVPAAVASQQPDRLRLAASELAGQVGALPAVAGRLLKGVGRGLTHPGAAAGDAARLARSLGRVLARPPAPPSPLLRPRSGRSWRFGVLECGLDELRSAGKAAGGSVNDAYIAALLGGLRRYHEHHGVQLDELPMMMPVSLRRHDDPVGGNRFTGALFPAPAGIVDPAERIASIRGTVLSVRADPALDAVGLVAPLFNRVPPVLTEAAFRRVGGAADLSASNVPGIPYPVYLAGARIDRVFPFGPLPAVAVMAAMVSHTGTCCIGLNIDATAVDDPDLLLGCFSGGLDEVLSLSRPEGSARTEIPPLV